jgi:hypothetical protein
MSKPALSAPKGLYVCVGTRQPVKLGYTWRMWWGQTSFYLKPRSSLVGGLKISLHGPDPRHPSGPGFKIELDGEPPPADKVWIDATKGFLPCWFPGEPTRFASHRVVRLRWTSELFAPDMPSGPPTDSVRKGFVGTLAEPPPSGFATDIDLIVAKHAPYYSENEKDVISKNALLGPIKSRADEYLTGLQIRRSLEMTPTPAHLLDVPRPISPEDTVRGITAGLDPAGFVWICEVPMSRQAMQDAAQAL